MAWTNTPERYGTVAILLHWASAALLLVVLGLGLYMVSLPDAGYDERKITLILVHKSVGMGTLALLALRLGWRLGNPLPALAQGLPFWQQVAARFVHLAFYGVLFALPVTGWLMSSAGGYPVILFGEFVLPDLVPLNEGRFRFYIELHRWLADTLLLLLALHAGAALRHHILMKDDTLRRMGFGEAGAPQPARETGTPHP